MDSFTLESGVIAEGLLFGQGCSGRMYAVARWWIDGSGPLRSERGSPTLRSPPLARCVSVVRSVLTSFFLNIRNRRRWRGWTELGSGFDSLADSFDQTIRAPQERVVSAFVEAGWIAAGAAVLLVPALASGRPFGFYDSWVFYIREGVLAAILTHGRPSGSFQPDGTSGRAKQCPPCLRSSTSHSFA